MLRLVIIAVIAPSYTLLNSQDLSADAKSALIAVSIKMKQGDVPSGQKPLLILTTKNISKQNLFPSLSSDWRLHVEGEKGEPPRTYYHRQVRHEPGLPALDDGGPARYPLNIEGEKPYEGIPPGESDVMQFDLTVYYDLIPGQYTVYLEVQDKAGVWLRTNTVHFEIQPPPQ
jgi:hypothetical protein